jgi:hypothetical protein
MNIEEIKQWLDPVVNDEMRNAGQNPPEWPATKEKLIEALVSVGIDEQTAQSMFTSHDASLRILEEITRNYEDVILVIQGDEAIITPWNNIEAVNWRGYAEGGTTRLALILLILCAKCYPLDLKTAWYEDYHFYVNADWHKEKYGVTY